MAVVSVDAAGDTCRFDQPNRPRNFRRKRDLSAHLINIVATQCECYTNARYLRAYHSASQRECLLLAIGELQCGGRGLQQGERLHGG